MSQAVARHFLIGVLTATLFAGPVLAGSLDDHGFGHHRRAFAKRLAPEVRYRDPHYVAPRRHAVRLGQPDFLIHAYLPRTTETPIYNEPPSRFPLR